jgi:hypothetical protein
VHRPSSLSLGIASIAVTLATSAAAVLELLPRIVWIVLLVAGIGGIVWAAILYFRDRKPRPGDAEGREDLKAQLRAVDALRTWLTLLDDPDKVLPLEEDRVFGWAKKTYKVIEETAPAEADDFMGRSDAPLGSSHFATAYTLRIGQSGRGDYLETRADILRQILRSL